MASSSMQPKSNQQIARRPYRNRSRRASCTKISNRNNFIQSTSMPSSLNTNYQIDVSYPSTSIVSHINIETIEAFLKSKGFPVQKSFNMKTNADFHRWTLQFEDNSAVNDLLARSSISYNGFHLKFKQTDGIIDLKSYILQATIDSRRGPISIEKFFSYIDILNNHCLYKLTDLSSPLEQVLLIQCDRTINFDQLCRVQKSRRQVQGVNVSLKQVYEIDTAIIESNHTILSSAMIQNIVESVYENVFTFTITSNQTPFVEFIHAEDLEKWLSHTDETQRNFDVNIRPSVKYVEENHGGSASHRSSTSQSIRSTDYNTSSSMTINLNRQWTMIARHSRFSIEYKDYIRSQTGCEIDIFGDQVHIRCTPARDAFMDKNLFFYLNSQTNIFMQEFVFRSINLHAPKEQLAILGAHSSIVAFHRNRSNIYSVAARSSNMKHLMEKLSPNQSFDNKPINDPFPERFTAPESAKPTDQKQTSTSVLSPQLIDLIITDDKPTKSDKIVTNNMILPNHTPAQIALFADKTFENCLQTHFDETYNIKINIEPITSNNTRPLIKMVGQEKFVNDALDQLLFVISLFRTKIFEETADNGWIKITDAVRVIQHQFNLLNIVCLCQQKTFPISIVIHHIDKEHDKLGVSEQFIENLCQKQLILTTYKPTSRFRSEWTTLKTEILRRSDYGKDICLSDDQQAITLYGVSYIVKDVLQQFESINKTEEKLIYTSSVVHRESNRSSKVSNEKIFIPKPPVQQSLIKQSPIQKSNVQHALVENSSIQRPSIQTSPIKQVTTQSPPIKTSGVQQRSAKKPSIYQSSAQNPNIERSFEQQRSIRESDTYQSYVENSNIERSFEQQRFAQKPNTQQLYVQNSNSERSFEQQQFVQKHQSSIPKPLIEMPLIETPHDLNVSSSLKSSKSDTQSENKQIITSQLPKRSLVFHINKPGFEILINQVTNQLLAITNSKCSFEKEIVHQSIQIQIPKAKVYELEDDISDVQPQVDNTELPNASEKTSTNPIQNWFFSLFERKKPDPPQQDSSVSQVTSTSHVDNTPSVIIGKSKIIVCTGDLTKQAVDLIVVCSTSRILCDSITSAAGSEVKNVYEYQSSSGILAVETSGGNLPCKNIIFRPWEYSKNSSQDLKQSITIFVESVITHAIRHNLSTIAFPSIGCGQLGHDPKIIAEYMLGETYRQIKTSSSSQLIVSFVLLPEQKNAYAAFVDELNILKNIDDTPTSISFDKQKVKITLTGSDDNEIYECENKIKQLAESCSHKLHLTGKTDIGDWPQNTIQKYYEYCLQKRVIPTLDIQNSTIDLIGPKDAVFDADKYYFQLTAETLRNARIQVISRGFIWSVEVSPGRWEQYPYKINDIIEDAKQKNLLHVDFMNEGSKRFRITFSTMVEQYQQQKRAVCRKRIDSSLPNTWDLSGGNNFKRIVLSNSSIEYKDVVSQFDKTMKGLYEKIIKIERIQNERWYKQYSAHRDEFTQRHNKPDERLLFHGCNSVSSEKIVHECFNRSFAGVNGVVYGCGVYFHEHANYSHNYAKPDLTTGRTMFLARVLIGKTCLGSLSMKVPPEGFDTTTDGRHIFVVYHDAAAYGEHLITYK